MGDLKLQNITTLGTLLKVKFKISGYQEENHTYAGQTLTLLTKFFSEGDSLKLMRQGLKAQVRE
jgi:hypothetical protein